MSEITTPGQHSSHDSERPRRRVVRVIAITGATLAALAIGGVTASAAGAFDRQDSAAVEAPPTSNASDDAARAATDPSPASEPAVLDDETATQKETPRAAPQYSTPAVAATEAGEPLAPELAATEAAPERTAAASTVAEPLADETTADDESTPADETAAAGDAAGATLPEYCNQLYAVTDSAGWADAGTRDLTEVQAELDNALPGVRSTAVPADLSKDWNTVLNGMEYLDSAITIALAGGDNPYAQLEDTLAMLNEPGFREAQMNIWEHAIDECGIGGM